MRKGSEKSYVGDTGEREGEGGEQSFMYAAKVSKEERRVAV